MEPVIYTAGLENYIIVWDQKGHKIMLMKAERVWDMHITNDGKFMINLGATNHRISIIDIKK